MGFGLSLAGGGIRGAAHVGVLKALIEEGFIPDSISGTSAGSIVAGLYAYGLPINEMEELVMHLTKYGRQYIDLDYLGIIKFIPQMLAHSKSCFTGFIKGDRLSEMFCALTRSNNINELAIKLVIPAVDLCTGKTIVFTNEKCPAALPDTIWENAIPLCEAIMASCSIPGVFRPRGYQKYLLVDGGVTNNLPVDLLRAANVDKIIAVDIGVPYGDFHNSSIFEVVTNSFSVMSYALKECTSVSESLLLKPPIPKNANLLSFEQMKNCMDAGYEYTRKMMPRIRRVLEE